MLMHAWTVRTAARVSNRLDFRHPSLRTALEQAASGPARPYAKAGSNLAALIADERALVGQCPRSFRHRLQRPFDLGLRVGGAQHRPDKRRKAGDAEEPAWERVTKLLARLVTDQVFERESHLDLSSTVARSARFTWAGSR